MVCEEVFQTQIECLEYLYDGQGTSTMLATKKKKKKQKQLTRNNNASDNMPLAAEPEWMQSTIDSAGCSDASTDQEDICENPFMSEIKTRKTRKKSRNRQGQSDVPLMNMKELVRCARTLKADESDKAREILKVVVKKFEKEHMEQYPQKKRMNKVSGYIHSKQLLKPKDWTAFNRCYQEVIR